MPRAEYRPFPTYITVDQLKTIADAVGKREFSLKETDELNVLLNQALTMFFRRRETKRNKLRASAIKLKYESFYRAIKRLEQAFPEDRSTLFWAISDMGERYALKIGLLPELPPFAPDSDIHTFWYKKRSFERLRHFGREVRRISKSLSNTYVPAPRPKTLSHSVRLIGQDLPDIYEHTFRRKYGTSRNGPGVRFVQAVLQAAGIKTEQGAPFSTEAILQYRLRVRDSVQIGKKV
jgi:hypothetical protein